MKQTAVERYVTKKMAKWLFLLDLGTWEVSLKFKKLKHADPERTAFAECGATWEYKTLDVNVNSHILAKRGMSKAFIEKCIVHEMGHAKNSYGFDLATWVLDRWIKDMGYKKSDPIVKMLRRTFEKFTTDLEERHVAEFELMPLIRQAIDGGKKS